jgi:hypothetical protein
MKTDADVELKFGSGHVVLVCYVTIDEIKSPGYDRGVRGSILSAVCFENLVLLHFFPLECGSFPNKYNVPTLHINSSAFFATLSLNPVVHSCITFSLYCISNVIIHLQALTFETQST